MEQLSGAVAQTFSNRWQRRASRKRPRGVDTNISGEASRPVFFWRDKSRLPGSLFLGYSFAEGGTRSRMAKKLKLQES
jgi:hypothetical protein